MGPNPNSRSDPISNVNFRDVTFAIKVFFEFDIQKRPGRNIWEAIMKTGGPLNLCKSKTLAIGSKLVGTVMLI